MGQVYSEFVKESPYSSPQWRTKLASLPTVLEDSLCSTPRPAFIVHSFFLIFIYLAALGQSCGRRDICGLTWDLPSWGRDSPVMVMGSAGSTWAVLLRGVWEGS